MKQWVLVCALLLGSAGWAQGIDGVGRISVGGGFRWVPNWWFQSHAADLGTPVIPTVDGGGAGFASFGLGVTTSLEVSIDLLFGYHEFALRAVDGGTRPFSSLTAGAVIGGRLVGTDVFWKGFSPYLSAQAGPMLSALSARDAKIPEKVTVGFVGGGGFTQKIMDRYGVGLDVRYVYARNAVPDISGINVGGVMFSVHFTVFFPPALKRDLDVPGF